MAKEFTDANESVSALASGLIANYHPELASARISYIYISKAPSKNGRKLYGKVQKASGFLEWSLEVDYVIFISQDLWNEAASPERTAALDHLLETCTGEEDEKTGEMKWLIRDPDVQEFSSILDRHGAWNPSLAGFISVAKQIDLSGLEEATTVEHVDLTTDTEEE